MTPTADSDVATKHKTSKKDKAPKEDIASDEVVQKKKEKRKRKDEHPDGENRKKRKKDKKAKDGLPDPAEDSNLSNQGRKALVYAFQFGKTSFKFQKARQNWLLRNLWNAEEIPETYMPLVVVYLASMQGSARETLSKKCQSILDAPSAPAATTEPSADTTSSAPPADTAASAAVDPSPVGASAASTINLSRARTLLNALAEPTST